MTEEAEHVMSTTKQKEARSGGQRKAIVVKAADGVEVDLGIGVDCVVRVKVGPLDPDYTHFSVVGLEFAKHGYLNFHSHKFSERVVICSRGAGWIYAEGKRHPVSRGTTMFWGNGLPVKVEQAGEEPLVLSVIALPPGPESRVDLFGFTSDHQMDLAALREIVGVQLQAENGVRPTGGNFVIVQDNEGDEYWQAAPSLGVVSIMLAPPALPVTHFCVASQQLDPGAFVRPHGHVLSEEIVIVTEGAGAAVVDGVEYAIAAGDLIVLPPPLLHNFINNSDKPLKYCGVFLPPSVEAALRETGLRKVPGQVRPEVERNPITERLLVEKYGFIIPGVSHEELATLEAM
jgi:quercetin dioxygenase-like cupin family protein